ncbi:MAG: alpha/beta hydrolase [Xenococcaceae cyanobacterium MO_167.B52]|nr:alpha/beta hydrolase [Xenococcaceae cyanobacterium MO_167.B52]
MTTKEIMIDHKSNCSKKTLSSFLLAISCGLLSVTTNIQSGIAAERIKLVYGPFTCSLSVESLKVYAETGEVTPEFKPYTKFLNQQNLMQLRHWLQKDFDRNVVGIHEYTHSPNGEELLQEIGAVVTTHSKRNGFYAIRSALIKAATKSDDWTIIDVIQQFPTENMQINTKKLFTLKSFWKESNVSQH